MRDTTAPRWVAIRAFRTDPAEQGASERSDARAEGVREVIDDGRLRPGGLASRLRLK